MLAYGTWAKLKTQEYTSDEFFLGGFRRVRLFFKLTCDRVAIFLIIWFYYRNLCYMMTILNLWFAAVETQRNTAIGPRWVCVWVGALNRSSTAWLLLITHSGSE